MGVHGGRPGTRPSSLSRPGERLLVLISPARCSGTLFPTSPPPSQLWCPARAGLGTPALVSVAPLGGTQGTGCERHPEASHVDPVLPGAPFGAEAWNLSGGRCPARISPGGGRWAPGPWEGTSGGRGGGGQADRALCPGRGLALAHRRGGRVRGQAAQGAWEPRITAPTHLQEPRGHGWLFSASSARPGPYRGQLKLNETHRPGARSSAHSHTLVRAPGPLPLRPLRCV